MRNENKKVQKMDNFIDKINRLYPKLDFRAKQVTTRTDAKGWGVRIKREQTHTTIEPLEKNENDGS